jgi:glycine/D-amino acid oxidase-like deaminating enzyme
VTALRHTRHGWWIEDATAAGGPVDAAPSLSADTTADVLVVGGGYLGMWTAWQVKQLAPDADVLLVEAELCGHGPSGRNGGFVSTLWDDLPTLRERAGDARAVETCRASERPLEGIRSWCDDNSVDAWYVEAPTMLVATADAQVDSWNDVLEACRAVGAPEELVPIDASEVARRCASPLFRGGGALLHAANVHPARLSLGLRARLLERGVRVHERTRVRRLHRDGRAETDGGGIRARAAVLAVNSAAAAVPGHRLSLAVASSHMVVTEPVPDVLEEVGWTGGEAIADSRTMLHYLRATRDGRIAFGWGGGRMGFGGRSLGRLEVDPRVVARVRRDLELFFPQLRTRAVTHAWGGPIDVSPTHLPMFGSRGVVHHGYGFTGNGVGPSYLGGEILARLALDRRDELTRLAIVEPDRKLFPPEPLRWLGGSLIRSALVRRDDAEDAGRSVDPFTSLVASLPRRLGLHLPR